MARELQIKVVDAKSYAITPFSATKGLKMLVRLSKILGEPLAVLSGAQQAQGEEQLAKLLSVAVQALVTRLDEDSIEQTVKQLLDGVVCDNKQILFDLHFQGEMGHLFKVLRAVLEVQYGDFFAALAALRGQSTPNSQA